MKSFVLCTLLSLGFCLSVAQRAPRVDDHLWRRRVVMKVDLREKVNRPLVEKEGKQYVASDSRYQHTQGMIKALVDGWREGKYPAFRADTLHAKFEYAQFVEKMKKYAEGGPTTPTTPATDGGATEDDGGDDFDSGDDFGGDEDFGGDDFGGDATGTGATAAATGDVVAASGQTDIGTLEYGIEIIEDRIFDKGRGDMVYDIKYIVLKFIDPDGAIPDENMVAFAYGDPNVQEQLDQTQWKNRFNDSENRSIREIFDLRLFNATILNVGGGANVNTLDESEKRKQQLIEMEHHLWSY